MSSVPHGRGDEPDFSDLEASLEARSQRAWGAWDLKPEPI